MLADTARTMLVSTLGWCDKNALWIRDLKTGETKAAPIGDARWLSLHAGIDDYFAVAHHYQGDRLDVTVHSFASPEAVLGRLSMQGRAQSWDGDDDLVLRIPRRFTEHLRSMHEDCLVTITPEPRLSILPLSWHNEDEYDLDYQSVIGAVDVPGTDLVLVSVQRDSNLVLFDPKKNVVVRKVPLADRHGNPEPRFIRGGNELWVIDYDTVVRLDPKNWSVIKAAQLQEATEGGAMFLGGMMFSPDESRCAIARPGSGDVLVVDTESLDIVGWAVTSGQPLDVALIGARVIARDWKSGNVLEATIREAKRGEIPGLPERRWFGR